MVLFRPYFMIVGFVLWLFLGLWCVSLAGTAENAADTGDDLRVEVTNKGAGKQVVISDGVREWFLLIEVTPENTVVIRQEKDHDRYIVDESETHDRPMTLDEVDAAISGYVNSVKMRARKN
ncbi:MAG: hypothetical protein AB7P24_17910 [Nitrospira sp.]